MFMLLNQLKKVNPVYLLLILVPFLLRFKSKKKHESPGTFELPPDVETLPATEKYAHNRANQIALQIHSAMNTGWFGWTEDEDEIIKLLNQNKELKPLLEHYYAKLTGESLFDEVADKLTSDQLGQLDPFFNDKITL